MVLVSVFCAAVVLGRGAWGLGGTGALGFGNCSPGWTGRLDCEKDLLAVDGEEMYVLIKEPFKAFFLHYAKIVFYQCTSRKGLKTYQINPSTLIKMQYTFTAMSFNGLVRSMA